MRADIRRKLSMARRVHEFSATHPSKAAGDEVVFARFEERLTRAEALVTQQRSGRIREQAAAHRRVELRQALHTEFLPHLIRVGAMASKEVPELLERFQLPLSKASAPVYLNAVRSMLTEAEGRRELLLKRGMEEGFLEELRRVVAEFEAATDAGDVGRREHVGARAELEVVTAEVMELVGVLDGQNRYRFREDAESLAAWRSVRNVDGPFHRKGSVPGEADGTGPAGAGAEQPAA